MTSLTSRILPYSTRPVRLLAQLFSDFAVFVWTAIWVLVGMAVYDAIATIAEAGRQVENGANGIAGSLASAGHGAQHIPLVGDAVSKPLASASEAALDIAGAGHNLDTTASWLAVLLALAVVAVPILIVVMPWLFLRAPVLPAQMDRHRPGRYSGRRTAAGAAGVDEPAAAQADRDQRGPGRCLAPRGSRHHPGTGRA